MNTQTKKGKQTRMILFPILLIGILIVGGFGGRALGWWGMTMVDDEDTYTPPYIAPTTPTEPYVPPTPEDPEPEIPDPIEPEDPPYIPPTPEDPEPILPEIIIDEDGNVVVFIPEDPDPEPETVESNTTNIILIVGIVFFVFGTIFISMNKKKK